jgi:hypothetical protein
MTNIFFNCLNYLTISNAIYALMFIGVVVLIYHLFIKKDDVVQPSSDVYLKKYPYKQEINIGTSDPKVGGDPGANVGADANTGTSPGPGTSTDTSANPNINIGASAPLVYANCDNYNEDDTNISNGCLDIHWKRFGCNTDISTALTAVELESLKKQPYKNIYHSVRNLSDRVDDTSRTKCYGSDKTKWPKYECVSYKAADIGVSKECLAEQWRLVGCTTDYTSADPNMLGQWSELSYLDIVNDMRWHASTNNDQQKNQCYGS